MDINTEVYVQCVEEHCFNSVDTSLKWLETHPLN